MLLRYKATVRQTRIETIFGATFVAYVSSGSYSATCQFPVYRPQHDRTINIHFKPSVANLNNLLVFRRHSKSRGAPPGSSGLATLRSSV